MTLEDLAIKYKLTPEELEMCSHYLVALRMKKKGMNPEEVNTVVNHWDRIKKAVQDLEYAFRSMNPLKNLLEKY